MSTKYWFLSFHKLLIHLKLHGHAAVAVIYWGTISISELLKITKEIWFTPMMKMLSGRVNRKMLRHMRAICLYCLIVWKWLILNLSIVFFVPFENAIFLVLLVCLFMWGAGNCSITESLAELIQQVRQDLAGALGGQPYWQAGWKRLAP